MLVLVRIPEQIPKPPPMSVIRSLPSKLDLVGFAIYFQGVKGASPTMGGVDLLPSILSHMFAAVSSGMLRKWIYFLITCVADNPYSQKSRLLYSNKSH